MNQRALELARRTSFEFAPLLRPINPLAELVSSELSDNTSNVNEPLVPTVTSPVKVLVSLIRVRVAPSLTICARSGETVTANIEATRRRDWIWVFIEF